MTVQTNASEELTIRGAARRVTWNAQATRQDGESLSKSVAETEGESVGLSTQEGISRGGWLFSRTSRSDGQTRTLQTSRARTTSSGQERSHTEAVYALTLNFLLEVTWPDGSVSLLPIEVQESETNLVKARLRQHLLHDGEQVQVAGLLNRRGVIEPSAIHNLTTGAVIYEPVAGSGPVFLPARQPGTLPDIRAIQRAELAGPATLPGGSPFIRLDVSRLRLARVLGVRNFWEEAEAGSAALREAAVSALVGLHTGGEPALQAIVGRPEGIAVYTGLGPLEPLPAPLRLPPPAPIRLLPPPPEPEPEPPPPAPRRRRSMLLLIPATTAGAFGLALIANTAPLDTAVAAVGFGGLTGLGLYALRQGLRRPAVEPAAVAGTAVSESFPEETATEATEIAQIEATEATEATEEAEEAEEAELMPVAAPPAPEEPPDVARETLLAATLSAVYPDIELSIEAAGDVARLQETLAAMPFGGIVVGTPATHQAVNSPTGWPLEELVRGLRGRGPWALVTIAVPAAEAEAQALWSAALRARQQLADAAQAGNPPRATAERYGELLEAYLRKLERGHHGLWHVGVIFLAADETTFRILAGRLKAFGGPEALPDPLRVIRQRDGVPGIARLELVATPGPSSGHVRYPYRWLSLLESGELAAWLRPPAEEAPGYSVKGYAAFGKTTGRGRAGDAVRDLGRIKG